MRSRCRAAPDCSPRSIATFAEEMSDFLKTSELTETRAFVHSFVKEIEVKPGRAAIVYSIPTPDDSPMGGADAAEIALNGRVRSTVQSGGPAGIRTQDTKIKSLMLYQAELPALSRRMIVNLWYRREAPRWVRHQFQVDQRSLDRRMPQPA